MDLGDIASSWSSRILQVGNQCIIWDRRRDAANNNGDAIFLVQILVFSSVFI